VSQLLQHDLKTVKGKKRLRILHVDDDQSVLEISKHLLMDMGNFEVDSSLSVDEAFQKLAQHAYDVVVSDYEMPQKNGLDFLKALRLQKNEVAFILFTGKGSEEVAAKALNLGAEGYYNKEGFVETVYEELSFAIQMVVKRRYAQISLMERRLPIKNVLNFSPGLIWSCDLSEHGSMCEFNQGGADVEAMASLKEHSYSASLPTIKCDCGAQILVIPDLCAMNRAIESHVAWHKRKGLSDGKDSGGNVKVKDFLIKQLLKTASDRGE
jgi:CheY-like chemotaxis protein